MNVWRLANILFIFNIVTYDKKEYKAVTTMNSEKGRLASA
jgi:hypothetical protein